MCNVDTIEEIYNRIKELVDEGKSSNAIFNTIEDEFKYTTDYIDKLFTKKYKITYNLYVKKSILIRAYNKWIENGCPKLTNRSTIDGIKEFKCKFIRIFNMSPEEAQKENSDLTILMPDHELIREFNNSPLISDYKISSSGVHMTVDLKQMLFFILQTPVFMFPKEELEKINFFQLPSTDSKKILILILQKSIENDYALNKDEELEFTLPIEQLESYLSILDNYNVDNPTEFSNNYIFSLIIDDKYYHIFSNTIDKILRFIQIRANHDILKDKIIEKIVEYIKSASFFSPFNIQSLAEYINIDTDETIELLWKYVKLGIIRFAIPYGFIK